MKVSFSSFHRTLNWSMMVLPREIQRPRSVFCSTSEEHHSFCTGLATISSAEYISRKEATTSQEFESAPSFCCLYDDLDARAVLEFNAAMACFFMKKRKSHMSALSRILFVSHTPFNDDRKALM